MEFLFSLADEISVIHWGQVIARGTPAELQGQSLGRGLQPGAAQLMLDVAAIDTFYGETQALFGVSLSVRAGEVLALLGANGAGKTTVLRSILGLTRARRGDIRFQGSSITAPRHARDRPRRHRLGAGRPPPVPDADGRQEPVARREAHRLPRLVDGRGDRHLHAAQVPDGARGRDAVGRRDADGGHRARAAGRAGPDAVRRAEPGPRAQDRRRRAGRDPPPQGGRASPPSWWSRTPTLRSASPTAWWCCRTARSPGRARPRRSPPIPASSASCSEGSHDIARRCSRWSASPRSIAAACSTARRPSSSTSTAPSTSRRSSASWGRTAPARPRCSR